MKIRRSKSHLGFIVKMHRYKKGLLFYEPANASKAIYSGMSKSVEKAYHDMSVTQERFNDEREKIREKLHTPVICGYDPMLFMDNRPIFRNLIENDVTPEMVIKKNKADNKYSGTKRLVNKDLDSVNGIIEQCDDIKRYNSNIKKKIPEMMAEVKKNYEIARKLTIKPNISNSEKLIRLLVSHKIKSKDTYKRT